jgi:hypothetical protein
VQEHEGKKGRVEVVCHYRDDLRAAIREAMQALGHSLPSSDSAAGDQKQDKAVPASLSSSVSNYIASLVAERDELRQALTELVGVIDAAGLHNLSRGVAFGPTVWYVKASDAIDAARLSAKEPT